VSGKAALAGARLSNGFRLPVKRSIELEFNGRFTDTWNDNHTF
jgi:hypothetical protein